MKKLAIILLVLIGCSEDPQVIDGMYQSIFPSLEYDATYNATFDIVSHGDSLTSAINIHVTHNGNTNSLTWVQSEGSIKGSAVHIAYGTLDFNKHNFDLTWNGDKLIGTLTRQFMDNDTGEIFTRTVNDNIVFERM